ncbi:MAG: Ig-like domain-containing protein [Bacteroidia bacterium]|nr:Ig-like domain-containing protein [Bacteroidia bacterium]
MKNIIILLMIFSVGYLKSRVVINNCGYLHTYGDSVVRMLTAADTTGVNPGNAGSDIAWNFSSLVTDSTYKDFHMFANPASTPCYSNYNPQNNALNVTLAASLGLTFNENVQKGAGNIVIKNASDSTVFQTIAVTNAAVTVNNMSVSISHDPFIYNTTYFVMIDSAAIQDITGNSWTGINDAATWKFTTQDITVDWCNLQWPASGAITEGGTFDVYAQVLEAGVTEATGQGAGITAWIGYSTTNSDPSGWTNWIAASYHTDNGNNDEYLASLSGLVSGTYYYASRFQLNGGPYRYGGYCSCGGDFWDGITFVSGVLTVSEPDIVKPTVISFSPTDNASDVIINSNLVIKFSEPVQKGTGSILIQKSADSSFVQLIDVTTTSVTVSDSTVTINPDDFLYGTGYYIQIDSSAVTDMAGNKFAGIYNATTWNFTTGVNMQTIDWCNLQWPDVGSITLGGAYVVYAQVYVSGITNAAGQGSGITAWIGYGTANPDPSTWTNWISATYNADQGNNDEYMADIGASITSLGTWYYASLFHLDGDPHFYYGGYNSGGGGFWDGANNISGVLDVITGINEISNNVSVSVFPVPASGMLNINIQSSESLIYVKLLNTIGKVVYSEKIESTGNIMKSIPVDKFAKGVYLLNILGNEMNVKRTVIIQ